ncbi:MAG TPA: 4Fe-4S dicluster domain-containing protein, partial [Geminicoccaceae bacterium]|nr:4Fe-4S dicluster domain-containing protein [Geminicoccaceae bacterium]
DNGGISCRNRAMQTTFTLAQLADPDVAEADKILRACVHCGFCTATCPTYVLLGDELDSPRGRIYLIKEMLEALSARDGLRLGRLMSEHLVNKAEAVKASLHLDGGVEMPLALPHD